MNTNSVLSTYCGEVRRTYSTGRATEHSYRQALQVLIQDLSEEDFHAINEPRRVKCGAPDLIVQRSDIPIGHVECKDIGVNLDSVETDPQLTRYRDGLPNLILTDYLEFRWYVTGTARRTVRLAHLDSRGGIMMNRAEASNTTELFDGFFEVSPPEIGSPGELVRHMAAKARLLRESILRLLDLENSRGPLLKLLAAYREVLIADLSPEDLADLQAQTAVYGLFAARCVHDSRSGPFTRQSAVFAETTPFLRDVFGQVAGPGIDPGIEWIVDDLARTLNGVDMRVILAGFGSRTRRKNPVVDFYEDFLSAYDPGMRSLRGVYYTPEPVVAYIVRSVDCLLRTRFALADGLADTATVSLNASGGGEETGPRVLILDPAAGTGTFLREAIALIRETIKDQGLGGAWPDYVRDHLLDRLFGFELLMAPYAVCHLNLADEIGGAGSNRFGMPEGQRFRVFLTNALEKAHEGGLGPMFTHNIALEAFGADSVKRENPVMVVLGNPPYSGHSSNNSFWIRRLLRGWDGNRETESYFTVDGEPLREANPKWLNDDYVKFIRLAQWRIERTGEGVLGYVTSHSYLDNLTFRGMRQSLMRTFDEIYLLDLHGNAKRKESAPDGSRDENVFDIQQGVAIGLFVKRSGAGDAPAKVFHADLWGEREAGPDGGKYGWLSDNDVETTDWTELSPKSPLYLFVPRDEELAEEYERGWRLPDIFPVNSVGIVTARDKLAIWWTAEDMGRVARDFVKLTEEAARSRYGLGKDAKDWRVSWAQEDLSSVPDVDAKITPVLYRPFDTRFTFYSGKSRGFICRPRREVMQHMLTGANLGLICCRQQSQAGAGWGHCGVTRSIVESCAISNKTREINYLFPLYTGPEKMGGGVVNLNQKFIDEVSAATGLRPVSRGTGDLASCFGPEDMIHYIYAVFHSTEYRSRYADFLKSDFPRVPVISDPQLFAALAGLGKRLVALHLMDETGEDIPAFPEEGGNRVERVRYAPPDKDLAGRVWINGGQYFDGVGPETWSFVVGGYRPAEKWLKDRKGRVLSFDDIRSYGRICAALAETFLTMRRIDKALTPHGGFPPA